MKKSLIAMLFIFISLNADVVICKGLSSLKVINGVMEEKKDISNIDFQLNTTNDIAVMILNNIVIKFKYIKDIQHPSGYMLKAYSDGVSQDMLYSEKFKVAIYKFYEIIDDKQIEYIATNECKNKEYE